MVNTKTRSVEPVIHAEILFVIPKIVQKVRDTINAVRMFIFGYVQELFMVRFNLAKKGFQYAFLNSLFWYSGLKIIPMSCSASKEGSFFLPSRLTRIMLLKLCHFNLMYILRPV